MSPIFIYKREAEPTPTGCTTIFDYDFTTETDANLISDWRTSVNENFWLKTSTSWLRWVNYVTDSPASIELPVDITTLKGKKLTFSREMEVGTHTRRGGSGFWLVTKNTTWSWYKDQYTSWISLWEFPMYATSWTWWGMYSWANRWQFRYTEGTTSTQVYWDQWTVYMWTYSTPNLWLTIWTWTWWFEWEWDFDKMEYTVEAYTIVNWTKTTWTFTRTFNNLTATEQEKLEKFFNWEYWQVYRRLRNGRWYGQSSYDINFIKSASVNVCGGWNYYFSSDSFNEYQSLVNSVWSINFLDSWSRFRFNYWVYIWNRTALDFDWSTMRTINLDSLTVTSSKSSSINGRVRYFWNNRILTSSWIIDFQWNIITSFSYDSVTPWLSWEVRAKSWSAIYRGVVDGDMITFTQIWSITDFYRGWWIRYSKLWLYYAPDVDYWADRQKWGWTLFDAETYAKTYIPLADNYNYNSMNPNWWAWPDGKYYQMWHRNYGSSSESLEIARRWKLHKLWTTDEWLVWSSVSNNSWLAYWDRFWKLLWNFVSWWMNSSNWTWNWYCTNNYYIDTQWNATLVQSNAFAYDSWVIWIDWFIDENWRLYPRTYWWWSWVILKPDVNLTLNRKNPYLWR